MKWITRSNIKMDRVAVPWLIRRFVDPGAENPFYPATGPSRVVAHGCHFIEL